MIHLVDMPDGGRVACDPELIAVVTSPGLERVHARRIHAEMCDSYAESDRREKTRAEMRAFTQRQSKRKEGL